MNKNTLNMKSIRHTLAICTVLFGLLIAPNAFSYKFINADYCPDGTHWSANRQPLDYYINQNGSSTISMTNVEQIMSDSFNEWSQPCCSDFSTNYAGQTSLTALNSEDRVVLSFQESNWPAQLGSVNQTIGVTLFQGYQNCTIYGAPIVFNAVGFDFCESGNGCTDLQSIATHEIGHNLGLDHSEHADATMFYAYSGGTGTRSLASDDISGVCALYPGSCSCSQDSDCNADQVCNSGQCEKAPCQSDDMCPLGKECNTQSGNCEVPTCTSDGDCDDGYTCGGDNHCVTDCPICRDCTEQADCGGGGGTYCAAVGQSEDSGKCLSSCGPDGSCPGDSECFLVPNSPASSGSCNTNSDCDSGEQCAEAEDGNVCVTTCTTDNDCGTNQSCMDLGLNVCVDTYQLCLNPDAGSSGNICPPGYQCHDDGSNGGNDACNGLGNYCSQDSNNCTTDNDVCVGTSATEGYCSCECSSDSDCGSGATCEPLQGGTSACVLAPDDPCDGVTCSSGETCQQGVCVDTSTNNDPGNNDPGNNDPGNNDPGNNDPGNNDPGNNDPGNNDPGNNDPGNNDPGNNDPGNNDPGNNDPGNNDPGNNDPGNNDPGNNDPGNNDPGNNGTPDAGTTPDIGENDQDDTGETINQNQNESTDGSDNDEGCGCSSTPMKDEVPGGLMLLGAFGLGIFWKRKR